MDKEITFPDMLNGMSNEEIDAHLNEVLIHGLSGMMLPDLMTKDGVMMDLKSVYSAFGNSSKPSEQHQGLMGIRGNEGHVIITDEYDFTGIVEDLETVFRYTEPRSLKPMQPMGGLKDSWPARVHAGTDRPGPRVTKRDKVIKARKLNKTNRKRARNA